MSNAPALAELQRDFQHFLLDQKNALSAHVVDAGNINAHERLEVYHEAYHLRLTEALTADFSTVEAILGETGFASAARDYIRQHPSQHASVRWFGRAFAEFIRHDQRWSLVAGVADAAALDWSISLSFDAADEEPLDLSVMASIAPDSWAGMRFDFHPAMRLVDLVCNVAAVRGARDADEALPEIEHGEMPVRWLVWRSEFTAMYRSMEVDEAFSLSSARDGGTFGDICEGLCEWIDPEHAAMHAAGMLKQWLIDGLIVAVHTD